MITLREAMKLCRIKDDEGVYLRPEGGSRFDSVRMTGKVIREKYDMKTTIVTWIDARFESYGYDFEGFEFGIQGEVKR